MADPQSTRNAHAEHAADVFTLPVHPKAAALPMFATDELADLVQDIKANGLLHPVTVKNGELVDGRNRLAACKLAGVEPRVEELAGDPVAYIYSANVARRNMSKGQRAMAIAKLYPEGHQGKKTSQKICEVASTEYVRQARIVLAWSPHVADAVLAGDQSLSDAYADALNVRNAPASNAAHPQTARAKVKSKAPSPPTSEAHPLPPPPPSTYEWVDAKQTEYSKRLNAAIDEIKAIIAGYTELDVTQPKLSTAERRTVRQRLVAARRHLDRAIVHFGGAHKPEPTIETRPEVVLSASPQ